MNPSRLDMKGKEKNEIGRENKGKKKKKEREKGEKKEGRKRKEE